MNKSSSFVGLVLTTFIALVPAHSAFALSGASGLSYNVPSAVLSGYSETWKDVWDPDYGYACNQWATDPETGQQYCTQLLYWEDYVSLTLGIYTPTGVEYGNGYIYDLYDAYLPYQFQTNVSGTWSNVGNHYLERDFYLGDGTFFSYIGTNTYYLGQTLAPANVQPQCYAETSAIIAEYSTYGVNFTPACSDFSNGGGSAHFTWLELNGGFSTGNPHNPWGIVKNILWIGLENTRANYGRGAIRVHSGYRCPHGNAAVNGAAQSRHMWGDAADISSASQPWSQAEWNLLQQAAVAAGATFIEPYAQDPTHVHADWR